VIFVAFIGLPLLITGMLLSGDITVQLELPAAASAPK